MSLINFNDLITVKGAAEICGVCNETIKIWEEQKLLLPLGKLCGMRIYAREEVERFAKARNQKRKELRQAKRRKTAVAS